MCVWSGQELSKTDDWIDSFSAKEIDILMSAVRAVRKRGLPVEQIRKPDFEVASLKERFFDIGQKLENGRGFVLIRSLPLDELSDEDCKLLFWGIGVQIGMPLSQNKHKEFITEVKDIGEKMGTITTRAYRAGGPLRFHTDQCDTLALMCVREAITGGHSRVVSSAFIHNHILEQQPDYLDLLRQPFHFGRQGEELPGEKPWYDCPVFDDNGGHFTSMFSRSYIESAQKLPGVPKLTPEQDKASNHVAKVADEHSVTIELKRGDIQLFNNHLVYHSRTDYRDHEELSRKRTQIRLWMASPSSRPLPGYLAPVWGDVGSGAVRGGVLHISGTRAAFPDWKAAGWTDEELKLWQRAAEPS
jgi:hypothetical protein